MEPIRIAILAAIGLALAASVWVLIDAAPTEGADAGEFVQGRHGGACLVPRLPVALGLELLAGDFLLLRACDPDQRTDSTLAMVAAEVASW